jgi:GNAT superfamily N-acetyltransferase
LPPFDELDVEIRPIQPGDKLTGLSLGNQKFTPLKTFAQRHAHKYELQSLARTYGAFNIPDNNKLAGYITIVCGEVVLDEGDPALVQDEGLKYLYNQYPAVKIARLAVDRRVRGKGIGESLLQLCLGITMDHVCPRVGCRFVMVDSKRESVGFYDRMGFTMLDTPANREREEPVMFIDLSKVERPA